MRHSVTLAGSIAVLTMMLALTGCPKKKGAEAGDGGVDAAVAAVDAAPAFPTASNADAVARFPDEAAIDHTAATLMWPATAARKSPPSGEVIAMLPKGTSVTQIASHEKYVLVVFENPKSAGDHLMGWVIQSAFSAPAPHAAQKSACPAGQTLLVGDETFCGKVCKVDTDCIGGQACMGTASLALGDGGAGAQVHACTAIVHPDGGAPSTPTAAHDAGAAPASNAVLVTEQVNGKCGAGYVPTDYDKKCHKSCQSAADCGGTAGVVCTRGKFCKAGP